VAGEQVNGLCEKDGSLALLSVASAFQAEVQRRPPFRLKPEAVHSRCQGGVGIKLKFKTVLSVTSNCDSRVWYPCFAAVTTTMPVIARTR
jgi:hypothetical protein